MREAEARYYLGRTNQEDLVDVMSPGKGGSGAEPVPSSAAWIVVVGRLVGSHLGSRAGCAARLLGDRPFPSVERVTYKNQRLQPLHASPASVRADMTAPQHVLIIGGGLGGPALAIALARRDIRSSIYELRSEPGDIGGALMLAPNALRVLDKVIGVYGSVRSSGYVLQRVAAYASDGMKLGEVGLGEETEDGYPAVRIRRPVLHKVLLEECDNTA